MYLENCGSRPADRSPIDQRIIDLVANDQGRIIDSQDEVGGYPSVTMTHRALEIPDGGAEAVDIWLKRQAEAVEKPGPRRWFARFFGPGQQFDSRLAGDSSDTDGDGSNAATERLFFANPLRAADKPGLSFDPTGVNSEITVRSLATLPPETLVPERSINLKTWFQDFISLSTLPEPAEPGALLRTYRSPVEKPDREFFRVRFPEQ